MHHVMFDIDGTLVKSYDFDGECYVEAVHKILGHQLDADWSKYINVTDAGILNQHIDEHGLQSKRKEIHADVKREFINSISTYLRNSPVQEVPGASEIISLLRKIDNLSLSIATGGWRETAILKLESAKIDVLDIPIASSDDHYSRIEIMKKAEEKAQVQKKITRTYFGDAEWDKKASEELGFNFVLVGDRTYHHQSIPDFSDTNRALEYIGV